MNSDFRISTSLVSHPKTKLLIRLLGKDGFFSLISLWSYVAENKPKGDLTGVSKLQIAVASDWDGCENEFYNALVQVGFIDELDNGKVVVHEWASHNPFAYDAEKRSDKARFSKMKFHYPEIWKELYDKGVRSINVNDYQRAVNDSLAPTPTPTPTPTPIPTPTLKKEIKDNRATPFSPLKIKPDFITEEDWKDLVTHRKKKRAANTARAYSGIIKELQKAVDDGHDISVVIDTICQRDWKGFKAEWLGEPKREAEWI